MFTVDQLICHMIGDYVLQSSWMAACKTVNCRAGVAHACAYTVPFAMLLYIQGVPLWSLRTTGGLCLICVTHYFIDSYRLARYVCWVKDFLAPRWIKTDKVREVIIKERTLTPENGVAYTYRASFVARYVCNYPWETCKKTGYPPNVPLWLSTWLMIIVDNTIHIICNGLVIHYYVG